MKNLTKTEYVARIKSAGMNVQRRVYRDEKGNVLVNLAGAWYDLDTELKYYKVKIKRTTPEL